MPDGSFGVTCLIFSRVRRECFGRRGLLVVVVVAHGALLGCPLLDGRSFECPVVGRAAWTSWVEEGVGQKGVYLSWSSVS